MQQLNVITFDESIKAEEFLLAMTRLEGEDKLSLIDAVFVTRREDGKVRVHQTADVTPREGAFEGGFWGLVFGTILLGPVGGVATGALTAGFGALMGKLIDAGIKDEFIAGIKDKVEPGRTALALLTNGGDEAAFEHELERFAGATLLYSNLPAEARAAVEHALAQGEAHHGVEVTDDAP